MKRAVIKNIRIVVGIILAGLLFLWVYDVMEKFNKQDVAMGSMWWTGKTFAMNETFPGDDNSTVAEQIAFIQARWYGVKKGMNHGRNDNYYDKFCDANIWVAVKNRPENPPPNLIVLATRNIDPSSLRTRLTEGDMQKRIRFDKHFVPPKNLPILKKTALFIYADGSRGGVGVNSRTYATYNRIYKGSPFDVTTNLASGLQVKYLTTDGEVIPTND